MSFRHQRDLLRFRWGSEPNSTGCLLWEPQV